MGDHRKSNSEVRKRKAADQFIRTAANKIRKLLKHTKKQPNDMQAKSKRG